MTTEISHSIFSNDTQVFNNLIHNPGTTIIYYLRE